MSKTAALPCKCNDDERAACISCEGRCACHDPARRAALLDAMEKSTRRRERQMAKIRDAVQAVIATGKVSSVVADVLMMQIQARYATFSCPGLERASKDWTRIGKLAREGKFEDMLAALETA